GALGRGRRPGALARALRPGLLPRGRGLLLGLRGQGGGLSDWDLFLCHSLGWHHVGDQN
ncbi:unnamed protein product, partial [Heterosigma akashiwo]